MSIEKVILTAKFQKRNAANQLVDITFVNGASSATTLTGQGTTESAARSDIANQLATFANSANTAAQDANDAVAALGS